MMVTNVNAKEALARKAENQDGFLGTVLNVVAAANRTTVADVVCRIGCSSGNIPRLALCKVPRDTEKHFAADVRQISEFVDCHAGRLANVIREYQAIVAMRRDSSGDSE